MNVVLMQSHGYQNELYSSLDQTFWEPVIREQILKFRQIHSKWLIKQACVFPVGSNNIKGIYDEANQLLSKMIV